MLRKLWSKWKAFGEFMGNIISRIVLSLFYFTIFMPFAVGTRLFADKLGIKALPAQYWHPRSTAGDNIESARRQA